MMAHHACGIFGSCFYPITKPNCVILGGTEHRKCLKPAKYVSTTGHLSSLAASPLSPPPSIQSAPAASLSQRRGQGVPGSSMVVPSFRPP